ncbi:MAG: ATP-binding protein, partial [Candidatus Thorarchaeota archaeon]
ESEVDKPIDLIPRSVLAFKPRVADLPDLHIDLGNGVIVGRSESFHGRYSTGGLGILGAVSETTDDVLTSVLGMPVKLDLMSPHVIFVAGKRGSGKSYTLGIIAEELALAMERQEIEVAVVMIDTVDVFRQMVEPNVDQADLLKKWGLDSRNFPVSVYIPRRTYAGLPDDVKKKARLLPLAISPRELTGSDWGYVLEKGGQLSTAMDNLISEVLDSVRRGYALDSGERVPLKRDFSIAEMIKCVETNPAIIELYQSSTRTAMIQRLRRANRLGVFHPGGTSAQDLAVGGQVTIIDVAPLGSDAESVLAILTNMLSRQVLTYRMAWTDEGTSAREELPPTWLIIDEAHTLVPKSGSTPAKEAIIGYAKLGRRFGCSLVLCTQQPSAVSDDAISQADIIISHSLSHDADIRALQQRAPAVMPAQFRDKVFISSLPRGVALVFDQTTANKRGFIMQVRPRLSQHGGADRLSGLFEAVRLMIPEENEIELEEIESTVDEGIIEDEVSIEELSEIPRPPVKLSKDDWQILDKWMKDYVEKMFEQKMQDFAITDEPAPRTEEILPVPKETDSDAFPEISERDSIDISDFQIRNFPTLSDQLLETALRRKVLYSRASHRFLFESDPPHRESVSIQSETAEPTRLLEKVLDVLLAAGMRHVETTNEEGFSFVFLRKDGMKASVSIGTCFSQVSIPIVLVGEKNRELVTLAEKIRQA